MRPDKFAFVLSDGYSLELCVMNNISSCILVVGTCQYSISAMADVYE